jgi:hypothetical protein
VRIDSTIVRAQPHAADAKKGGLKPSWEKMRTWKWVRIDSTIVRAQPHAADAKKGGLKPSMRTVLWQLF